MPLLLLLTLHTDLLRTEHGHTEGLPSQILPAPIAGLSSLHLLLLPPSVRMPRHTGRSLLSEQEEVAHPHPQSKHDGQGHSQNPHPVFHSLFLLVSSRAPLRGPFPLAQSSTRYSTPCATIFRTRSSLAVRKAPRPSGVTLVMSK